MEAKPTPTPWIVKDYPSEGSCPTQYAVRQDPSAPSVLLRDMEHTTGEPIACGFAICTIVDNGEQTEANAEFIVRAVNNHNKLLEACKAMVTYYGGMVDGGVEDEARNAVEQATAAIAAAEAK